MHITENIIMFRIQYSVQPLISVLFKNSIANGKFPLIKDIEYTLLRAIKTFQLPEA